MSETHFLDLSKSTPQSIDSPVQPVVNNTLDELSSSLSNVAQSFRVVKRTGLAFPFDDVKIAIAMTTAFLAVEGQQVFGSTRVRETNITITRDIVARLDRC